MFSLVIAQTPQWVNDWGVYLGFIVAFFSVIAFTYGFTKFAVGMMSRVVDALLEERVPPMIDRALEPIKAKQEHVGRQVAEINHAVNNLPPGSQTLVEQVSEAKALAKDAVDIAQDTARMASETAGQATRTLERIELNQVTHLLDNGVDPERIAYPPDTPT